MHRMVGFILYVFIFYMPNLKAKIFALEEWYIYTGISSSSKQWSIDFGV